MHKEVTYTRRERKGVQKECTKLYWVDVCRVWREVDMI